MPRHDLAQDDERRDADPVPGGFLQYGVHRSQHDVIAMVKTDIPDCDLGDAQGN